LIDTLATARSLEQAGMDSPQAEAVAGAIRTAVTEGAATKADLADLKAEIRAELNALTWRILGGVGLLLALFTAFERLLT